MKYSFYLIIIAPILPLGLISLSTADNIIQENVTGVKMVIQIIENDNAFGSDLRNLTQYMDTTK